jgi:hypothetical protein
MGNRTRLLVLSLVALLCSPALSAPPEADVPPEVRIAKEIAGLRKKMAEEHRKLARWCRGKKHKRTAHAHLLMGMKLCPEHRTIRVDLGYRKVGDEWVLRRPTDLTKLKDDAPLGDDYLTRDREVRCKRLRGLVRIAKMARKLGLDERAREILLKAVTIDGASPDPRNLLGHKKIGGRWFTPEEADIVDVSVECKKEPGTSSVGRSVGLPLVGWRAGRWVVESQAQEHEFKAMLAVLRRSDALAVYLYSGQRIAEGGPGISIHLLGSVKLLARYVDMQNLPAGRAAAAKKVGVAYGYSVCVLSSPLSGNTGYMADWCAHMVGGVTIRIENATVPAWILSGFSDYVSERIVGTMLTPFYTVEHSAGVRLGAQKPAAAVWRVRLRNMALLGEDPKSGVIFSSSIAGMNARDAMKAWSIVTYLRSVDPQALHRFLRQTATGKTTEALQKEYGLSPDALDEAWRAYIVEHG